MIPYIGDISANDAHLLAGFTMPAKNILEFGCGASTQVIAAHKHPDAKFASIDTEVSWIRKTQDNLALFDLTEPNFFLYDEFIPTQEKYDFVFDDGADSMRRRFALSIWGHIEPGGILALHDTRRAPDFRNVLEILARFQDEIHEVLFNYMDSNITLIYKRHTPVPYDNWQITEKKEPWQLGYGNPPEEFIAMIRSQKSKEFSNTLTELTNQSKTE